VSITVLYFAGMKDIAGCAQETVALYPDSTRLFDALTARYAFGVSQAQIRVAINGHFAAWDAPLQNGDVVAFIPPVSGG
jgi:molybdopterin synthase sulfur carrier subunit